MKPAALLTLIALAAAALPGVHAQTNPAHVEKAKIVGGGNTITLYGLPAWDPTNGRYKYWDTTITLEIGPNGKPTGNSATVSVPQAKARSTEFVPGTYASGGATCDLVNSAYVGRTRFDLNCIDGTTKYTASWITGPIAGHPWEADLVAAQLDTLIDKDEYAWGKTLYDNGNSTWFGCFNDPELLSARQVGDLITLVNYTNDKVADCQISLARQP